MDPEHEGATEDRGSGAAGKYLTFRLASEEYGLEILKVRELIGLPEITPLPKSAPHVRGVINLRGKVVPVVDLRLKFDMQAVDSTSQTVIVLVQLASYQSGATVGVLVDEVLEVRAIGAEDIEPLPNLQNELSTDFILGVGKTDERIVFLLDIDRILASADPLLVSESRSSSKQSKAPDSGLGPHARST